MNTRLYVGNLAYHTTQDTLAAAFARCGEVAEVTVMLDRMTGQSRGFGFVTMANADAAKRAVEEMNGALVDGRSLRVNEAEERRPGGGGGGGFGGGGPRGGGGGGGGRGGRDGGGRGGRDGGGRGGRW